MGAPWELLGEGPGAEAGCSRDLGVSHSLQVALLGMDILSALVTRLQDRFKAQIGTGELWANVGRVPRLSSLWPPVSSVSPNPAVSRAQPPRQRPCSPPTRQPSTLASASCWGCTTALPDLPTSPSLPDPALHLCASSICVLARSLLLIFLFLCKLAALI